jgi:chaperonin GroES
LAFLDASATPANNGPLAGPAVPTTAHFDHQTPPWQSAPDDSDQQNEHQHQKLIRWIRSPNIADEIDEDVLSALGHRAKREYEIDVESRAEWLTKTREAMDLAMQIAQEKNYPWPKAANVIYPLMTTAAVQFAARAYPAIINGRNIVKGIVVGDDRGIPAINPMTGQPITQQGPNGAPQGVWQVPPGVKQMRADRLGGHMSWQVLDEMPEWEPETDKLLHVLPITGCVFRKTYFDPGKGRNVSLMVDPRRGQSRAADCRRFRQHCAACR